MVEGPRSLDMLASQATWLILYMFTEPRRHISNKHSTFTEKEHGSCYSWQEEHLSTLS